MNIQKSQRASRAPLGLERGAMTGGRALCRRLAGLVIAGMTGLLSASAAMPVEISEFVAGRSDEFVDEDNDPSDWIEVRNVSSRQVNLEGWFLTDAENDLRRWRFPSTPLSVGEHVVVFASGKDRREPGRPLHTGFRLDADGEYLALVMPDGVSIATEFMPAFPEQFDGISYGRGATTETTTLIDSEAPMRFLIPADGALEDRWREFGFDDSLWMSGLNGLGFAAGASLSGTGLHSYWPIREGSGGVASNLIPGGAPGIIHGAAWMEDPLRGTVLDFDGVDDYVSAGSIPGLEVSSRFTWSFWHLQRSVPNLNAVILGNRSGGAPGSLQFIKFTPSNFEYFRDGNIGFMPHFVATGQWRHLAVVKEGGAMAYYDGGALVGNARAGGDIEPNPLFWGGDPGAPGEYIDGLIDDVSLWDRALSEGEIRELADGVSPGWLSGFGRSVATDVESEMRSANATAYLRFPFTVPANDGYSALKLRIRYDDGFVAYLNGTELARRNAPALLSWNSSADAEHPSDIASEFEEIDVTEGLDALVIGENVLAIHGLNLHPEDPDFLMLPTLEAIRETRLDVRYLDPPTPGAVNSEGFLGFVDEVVFDHAHGFYDAPFQVALSCVTSDATIRFTTDGAEPTPDHGTLYHEPLWIEGTTILRAGAFKPGYRTPRTQAQSFLFLDQILEQTGEGLPRNWGNDWEMDPRVVNHPSYADRIRDDMKSLPVVSLGVDPMDFWGPSGIYTLPTGRGDEYEIPCSAEMFFPDGAREGFQISCGVQIVGGASRTMTPKHGLGLTFKRRYGPPKLRYRFFENSHVDSFDFIALRPNFNMTWVRTDNSGPLNNANADGAERLHAIYVRDQFTKESQLAMGQPSAHERFVNLYINGVYWGLYNPSERTDASFAASYLGGEKEEYDTIFSDSSTIARAHDGDKNAWLRMMTLAKGGLAGAEAYAEIQNHLDVTNLADYMMLNFYCATVDWPWQNWNAARKRDAGGRFRFFIWDAEYTLETPPWAPDDRTGVGGASGEADSPARLYHELRKNEEWRMLFADRVRKHFFDGGALTANQAIQRFLRLCDTIDGAIVGESARWGDVVRWSEPYTRDVEWLAEKRRLLTEFFPTRTERVIQQFIRAGLYPELPAVVMSRKGGVFAEPFELTLNASSEVIYFTTDGSDPRLPGGAIAPGAQLYSEPVTISGAGRIMTRARQGDAWSALNAAEFSFAVPVAPPALDVKASESGIVISWPAHASEYLLEETDSLGTRQWRRVEGASGPQAIVRIRDGRRYYRLRTP